MHRNPSEQEVQVVVGGRISKKAALEQQRQEEEERLRLEALAEAQRKADEELRLKQEYISTRLESLSDEFSSQSKHLSFLSESCNNTLQSQLKEQYQQQYFKFVKNPIDTELKISSMGHQEINSFISLWSESSFESSHDSIISSADFAASLCSNLQTRAIQQILNSTSPSTFLSLSHDLISLILTKTNQIVTDLTTSPSVLSSTPESSHVLHQFTSTPISLGLWLNLGNASRIEGVTFDKLDCFIEIPKSGVAKSLPFERFGVLCRVFDFNHHSITRDNFPFLEVANIKNSWFSRLSKIYSFNLLFLPPVAVNTGDWVCQQQTEHFSSPVIREYPPPTLSNQKMTSSIRDLPELQYQIPLEEGVEREGIVIGFFDPETNQWVDDHVTDHVIDDEHGVIRFTSTQIGSFCVMKKVDVSLIDWTLSPSESQLSSHLSLDYGGDGFTSAIVSTEGICFEESHDCLEPITFF
ncbi:hypothetical protein GEMRC1_008643 [Eukaryota sp. GEM-RC1]